jgi:hypothetical protein
MEGTEALLSAIVAPPKERTHDHGSHAHRPDPVGLRLPAADQAAADHGARARHPSRDRLPRPAAHELRPVHATHRAPGQRAGRLRRRARPDRGGHGLGQPPLPGGLLRHPLARLRDPDGEHPPVARADPLHAQPRPGAGRDRARRHAGHARGGGRQARDPDHLHPDRRARHAAQEPLLVRRRVRGADGAGLGPLRLPRLRRERAGHDVLHHGHDRTAQGRLLQPPPDRPARDGPACDLRHRAGQRPRARGRRVHADHADVPRACLGLAVRGDPAGNEAGLSRPLHARGSDPLDRAREGHARIAYRPCCTWCCRIPTAGGSISRGASS